MFYIYLNLTCWLPKFYNVFCPCFTTWNWWAYSNQDDVHSKSVCMTGICLNQMWAKIKHSLRIHSERWEYFKPTLLDPKFANFAQIFFFGSVPLWQETPVSKMIGMYKTLALAYPRALLLSLGLSHRSCMKVLVSLELIGSSLAPYAALEILDFYCYQVMTPEKEKLEVSIYFS